MDAATLGEDCFRLEPNGRSASFPRLSIAKERVMQKRRNLKDLFGETLKDIYFAERQILRALPKMAYQAAAPELRQAFETHREETEGQVERLKQVFKQFGRPARGKTSEAIIGIIGEAREIMGSSRAPRLSTLVSPHPCKPSSTTRSLAMARSRPGRANLGSTTRRSFSTRRYKKRSRRTSFSPSSRPQSSTKRCCA